MFTVQRFEHVGHKVIDESYLRFGNVTRSAIVCGEHNRQTARLLFIRLIEVLGRHSSSPFLVNVQWSTWIAYVRTFDDDAFYECLVLG